MRTMHRVREIGPVLIAFMVYTGVLSSAVADRKATRSKGVEKELTGNSLVLRDVRVEEKQVARSSSTHFVLDVVRAEFLHEEGEPDPGLLSGELALPGVFSLAQNYPNPFNPTTTITFEVPGNAGVKQRVQLTVYTVRGKQVTRLVDTDCEPGIHRVVWNGKDERGRRVSSGVYLYTLRSGETVSTRKMILVQ